MIKPNELRIGNLVEWHTGSIETINARMILSISEISPDHLTPKGIPLTEEWLLKFGFKWEKYGLRKRKFVIRKEGTHFAMYFSNEATPFRIELQYIHQLQNLFFALTGEELTIKE